MRAHAVRDAANGHRSASSLRSDHFPYTFVGKVIKTAELPAFSFHLPLQSPRDQDTAAVVPVILFPCFGHRNCPFGQYRNCSTGRTNVTSESRELRDRARLKISGNGAL